MLEVALECLAKLQKLGYTECGVIGYIENRQDTSILTHNDAGDPYLEEPTHYVTIEEMEKELVRVCDKNRRINYGMCFVK